MSENFSCPNTILRGAVRTFDLGESLGDGQRVYRTHPTKPQQCLRYNDCGFMGFGVDEDILKYAAQNEDSVTQDK